MTYGWKWKSIPSINEILLQVWNQNAKRSRSFSLILKWKKTIKFGDLVVSTKRHSFALWDTSLTAFTSRLALPIKYSKHLQGTWWVSILTHLPGIKKNREDEWFSVWDHTGLEGWKASGQVKSNIKSWWTNIVCLPFFYRVILCFQTSCK